MKKFVQALLLASLCLNASAETLKLVIAQDDLTAMNEPLVRQTHRALEAALPDYQIVIERTGRKMLLENVEHREAALFISSAAAYRQALPYGARDLATAVSIRAEDPNQSDAGLVLVRGEELSLQRIQDLEGKRVAFNPDQAGAQFDMVRAAFAELLPGKKAQQIEAIKADLPTLLRALREKRTDAVVVPACLAEWYAEHHQIDTSWVRVLDPKLHTTLHCFHSTKLYPSLTLATTPSAPTAISRTVTLALLHMPPTAEGLSWQVATDFSETDRMLRLLEKDSNAALRRWSLPRIWHEYKAWFFLAFAGLAALVLQSFILSWLVQKRTRALSAALEKQKAAERQAKVVAQRLAKVQKIGVIGQMSSLFAHEIRQPLSAIGVWAYSLRKLLLKEGKAPDMVEAVDGILNETRRSEAIVRKIRDYAKSRTVRRERHVLSELVDEAVRSFHSTSLGFVPVTVRNGANGFVRADPFEIELAIVNLLRNAAEAQVDVPEPQIDLQLGKDVGQGMLTLTVTDRGPKLEPERFAAIESTLESSKPDGFGLGLAIVRSIAESHGGVLELFSSESGGLGAVFSIPEEDE